MHNVEPCEDLGMSIFNSMGELKLSSAVGASKIGEPHFSINRNYYNAGIPTLV